MFGRQKFAMLVAEFLGAAVLSSTVLAMIMTLNISFFTASAAGLVAGLMVLMFGVASGAHINPAVTIGLWSLRKIQTSQAIAYVAAQVLGGVAAWQLNQYFIKEPLTNLAGKNFEWRVMIAEVVGTFIFTFGVAAAVYQGYQKLQLAATIGVSLFAGIMMAALGSRGFLNPAVAVGVRAIDYAYMLGPIVGSIIGMNLYTLLFAPVVAGKPKSRKR